MASLGSDLVQIRKERELTFDDIQAITKLAPGIIESIENDSIFEDIANDTIYKRSYVRNYAKALHIDDGTIIEALNQVENGNYQGGLIENTAEEEKDDVQPEDEEDIEEREADGMVHDHSPEHAEDDSKPPPQKTSERSNTRNTDTDWVQVGHRTIASDSSNRYKWLWWAIGIIIIAAIIFFAYTYFTDDSTDGSNAETISATAPQPTAPADTLQESLLPNKTARSLPDTLTMTIVAVNGKLNPVHIYTDIMEKKRPYWISKNDTLHFEFVNTFRIQAKGKHDQLQLIFNGHIIKSGFNQFYSSKWDMIEIGRTTIKDHPEWSTPTNQAKL